MIPESQSIKIESQNIKRESFFTLSTNSAALMKILRSGIYSNKILACVREYSVNALEAHMLNGKQDTPIEITLPNYLNPILLIRDFGPGLDYKKVCSLICEYGSTTKDESNEFIGCFGIGSKAAFSYSNTFQIVSIHNGKKSIYNCHIDETEVGKISELSTTKTDEPSGIEIGIPVQLGDIHIFIKEAKNLFRFWRVPPIIKGCSDYTPIVNTYLLKNESGSWAFIENEEYYSTSFLVMGGVPYKISSSNITGLDGLHSKMLENNIVLFANIGDVTINSAREEVSYTPKSIAYIKAALRSVEAEAKGEIDKKFANCTSEYEVKKLYFQCFGGGTLSNVIHKTLFNDYAVEFNGKKINSYLFQLQEDSKFDSLHNFFWETTRRGTNRFKAYKDETSIDFYKEIKWKNIPAEGIMFYYIGVENFTLAKKLMKYYFTELNSYNKHLEVTVINFPTEQAKNDWFVETGIPESLFKELTSTVIIPKKPRKTPEPRQKNPKTNCIVYDSADKLTDKKGYHYDKRDWRFYDVDTENQCGLYVIKHYSHIYLDSASRQQDSYHDRERVMECIKMLEQISDVFIDNPVVYAFNESEVKKLGSNWVPLADLAKEALQLQHDKFDTAKIPMSVDSGYGAENIFYKMLKDKVLSFDDTSDIPKLIESFDFDNGKGIERYENLASYFQINTKDYDIKKIEKLKKLVTKELKNYPLLDNLTNLYRLNMGEVALYVEAKRLQLANKKDKKNLDAGGILAHNTSLENSES